MAVILPFDASASTEMPSFAPLVVVFAGKPLRNGNFSALNFH